MGLAWRRGRNFEPGELSPAYRELAGCFLAGKLRALEASGGWMREEQV